MARKGSYLERDIAIIFERIGFDISVNSKEFGFEADVIAKKGNFKILIQTKQYDNSYINVSDLLHQWASKGKHNKVDRTLVVIAGFKINHKFFDLAKDLDIYLWGDDILHELKRIETNKELYGRIGKLLDFKEIMDKFKKIDETNLSENIKEGLREQAILLSSPDFDKSIKGKVKKHKEEFERKEKEFQEKLKIAQETARRKRKIKIGIICAIIGLFILSLIIGIVSNKVEEVKFKNECQSVLKGNKNIMAIRNSQIINNYKEANSWIESNIKNINVDQDLNFKSEKYPLLFLEIQENKSSKGESFNGEYSPIFCIKTQTYFCGCRGLEEDGLRRT